MDGSTVHEEFFFPSDGSEEWLLPADARLAVHLLLRDGVGTKPRVLEIGVWKGAWTSVVLRNVPGSTVVGVDPYPGDAHRVRVRMLQRLESLGLGDRFGLHGHIDELDPSSRFDLVHIDGDHSEAAVWEDLRRAHGLLDDRGVIVVDDISHKWLPGVASATYRYCAESDLRMFLLTNAKGYFARGETAARIHLSLRDDRSAIAGVRLFQSFQEMTGHPYPEPSEVLGQPVLLARSSRSKPSSRRPRPRWSAALSSVTGRALRTSRRVLRRG